MGVDVVGYIPQPFVMYGAYAAPGVAVTSATSDSAASMSITTTSSNTKWLIEVDAHVKWSQGSSPPDEVTVAAKVDGSYVNCSGGFGLGIASNAGFEQTVATVRGRCVVTLATVAAHTILASLINGTGSTVTFKTVTITATLLTG